MIKILSALVITIICIILYCISQKIYGKDLLAPLSFFSIYFFITRVPRLLVADKNLYGFHDVITDAMRIKYTLMTLTFLLFFLIGGFVKNSAHIKIRIFSFENIEINDFGRINYKALFRVGLICFSIGAASKVFLIQRAGGLRTIWFELYNRTNMLAGMGYIDYLSICMTFGLAAIEICVLRGERKCKGLFILLCFAGAGLNVAFGNRSPLMKMIIALAFVYWYCSPQKKDIKNFLKIRYILLALVLFFIVMVLPTFRSNDFNMSISVLVEAMNKSLGNFTTFFDQISLYDEDIYTFNYFSADNYWGGRSFLSLLLAWVPRAFYPNKPPIDDGMYLRAIMKGYNVVPPMSVWELNNLTVSSSVPFTTSGIMYANFGYLGVIFGGLLTGIILVRQYKTMRKTSTLEDILLYQSLCTRLTLSVKGIVEILISVVIIKILCGFVYRIQGVNRPE